MRLIEIKTEVAYESEAELVFEAQRQIAIHTRLAIDAERFPIIIGGNCNTAVGAVSGVGAKRTGYRYWGLRGNLWTPSR